MTAKAHSKCKTHRRMTVKQDNVRVAGAIGVDLGDQRSQVCVLDGDGDVVEEATIATNWSAFERKFGSLERSRVVLETGTHANWVHDLLTKIGHEVIVANARKVRAISANERKSDTVDARILARLGRVDIELLQPVTVRAEQIRLDLSVTRARAALVETRTHLVNSVRGLAKTSGHRLPTCSAASLHKQPLDESLKPALAPLLEMLEQISKKISEYDKQVVELCKTRYPQTRLLSQVKGVGPLTSLYFVLVIADPERFKRARDVGAYFGLVPRRDQSGGRDPELRISKTGDRMGRTLLVQCAHHILGPFGEDSDLRRFGQKLAARGGKTAKRRAVVATARKLAVLLFALLCSSEVYEPLRNGAKSVAN
ncbi:MAG: IS110 family transposase [Planctomycetes bacterium]|nr:IS110 family transposase [Planctomycetota bacterium]